MSFILPSEAILPSACAWGQSTWQSGGPTENQRAPSGPETISAAAPLSLGSQNWVTLPFVDTRPILPVLVSVAFSVNHKAPSGPATIRPASPLGIGKVSTR